MAKYISSLVLDLVKDYLKRNKKAGINEVKSTFQGLFPFYNFDELNKVCFIKRLSNITIDGSLPYYSAEDLLIDGDIYRVSKEWSYHDQSEIDGACIYTLRSHIEELVSFYISEVKTKWLFEDNEKLKGINIEISEDECFETVGIYDPNELLNEFKKLLEGVEFPDDIYDLIYRIIKLLEEIISLESFKPNGNFASYVIFEIENYYSYTKENEYQMTKNLAKAAKLENDLRKLIEELRKQLQNANLSEPTRNRIKKILDGVLSKVPLRKKPSNTLGVFIASKFKIILYKNAIENWCPKANMFKKLFDVFVHELFHAFHYLKMIDKNTWEYDDESRIVKEGLTRFIEFKYSLLFINESLISNSLVTSWNDYDMYSFPYSAARLVNKFSGLSELMFKQSLFGTKTAYGMVENAFKIDKELD